VGLRNAPTGAFAIDPEKTNVILLKNHNSQGIMPYLLGAGIGYMLIKSRTEKEVPIKQVNTDMTRKLICEHALKKGRKAVFINGPIDHNQSEKLFSIFHNEIEDNDEVDIVINTNGGELGAAREITDVIRNHPGKTHAVVPRYALSGGTFIALACNTVEMSKNAYLSPVDPQVVIGIPFSSISFDKIMIKRKVESNFLLELIRDLCIKTNKDTKDMVFEFIDDKYSTYAKSPLMDMFFHDHTHDYKLHRSKLIKNGLIVAPIDPEYEKIFFDKNNTPSVSDMLDELVENDGIDTKKYFRESIDPW